MEQSMPEWKRGEIGWIAPHDEHCRGFPQIRDSVGPAVGTRRSIRLLSGVIHVCRQHQEIREVHVA